MRIRWIDDGEHGLQEEDRKEIQQRAIEMLKGKGEPTECGRCGGKPGDPGCGKVIHVIMDGMYEEARQLVAKKEEE